MIIGTQNRACKTGTVQHPGSAWAAAAVARTLKAGRRGGDLIPPTPPEADWPTVVEAVILHRVHGLLGPHVAELGMPDEYAARVSAAQRRLLDRGLAEIRDTDVVSRCLSEAGIAHLVVKGVVLGAAVGEMPALRGGGDIDVWVREEQVGDAEAVALANGWRRRAIAARLPPPSDTWRWQTLLRFAQEEALDHPERATLDLHWRLAGYQPELGFGFEEAYARSVPVPAAGPTVRTLWLEDTFVHVAQHGRKEAWPTLRHLVDVVHLVGAYGPERSRDLACRHQNVAVAILTAAHLDPSLTELVGSAHAKVRALAQEAWHGCLSLEYPQQIRRALTGGPAWRTRWRYESWLLRSAPDWPTRADWALQLAVPLRPLVDPDPPVVSLPREAIRSLIGGIRT